MLIYEYHFILLDKEIFCLIGRPTLQFIVFSPAQSVVKNLNMLDMSLCIQYGRNISFRFSSNSEANAAEILDNLEEMFPCY